MMALQMISSILFNIRIICFGNSELINVMKHERVIRTMTCFWSLIVLSSKENWPYYQIPTFDWLTHNYLQHATYPYNPLTIEYEHWLMVTGICISTQTHFKHVTFLHFSGRSFQLCQINVFS
jgi:hypothetical protein